MSGKSSSAILSPTPVSISVMPSPLLQRKCACGGSLGLSGECTECSKKKLTGESLPLIQPKLKISQPNDKYEQEADRVADMVMRMPEPKIQREMNTKEDEEEETVQTKSIGDSITPLIQRQIENQEEEKEETIQPKLIQNSIAPLVQRQVKNEEEDEEQVQLKPLNSTSTIQRQEVGEEEDEEETIQMKRSSERTPTVTPEIQSQIDSVRKSVGKLLPKQARAFMEPRFGQDFSKIRIHDEPQATKLTSKLNARAFTLGNDIMFNRGEFQPYSLKGQRLLAHELTHTMQQGTSAIQQAPARKPKKPSVDPDSIVGHPLGAVIQRQNLDCSTVPPRTNCPALPDNDKAEAVDLAVGAAAQHARQALNLLQLGDIDRAALLNPNLPRAFEEFFGDPNDEPRVANVTNQLDRIVGTLQGAQSAYNPGPPLSLQCANECEPICSGARAFYHNDSIFFCDGFFDDSVAIKQEATAMHESVHATLQGDEIDVYTPTRLFDLLAGEPAVDPTASSLAALNPDSFAAFILAVSGVGLKQARTKGGPPTDRFRGFRDRKKEVRAARRALAFAGLVIREGEDGLDPEQGAFLGGFRAKQKDVRKNLTNLRKVIEEGLVVRRVRRREPVRFRRPLLLEKNRMKVTDEFFKLDKGAQIWGIVDAMIDGLELPEASTYSGFLRRNAQKSLPQIPDL